MLLSSEILVKRWKHLGTFRGHRTAVYCAVVTRDGKYVITGSDDCLVKVCMHKSFSVSNFTLGQGVMSVF